MTIQPLLLAGLGLMVSAHPSPGAEADPILHHGRIVTVGRHFSIQQALAIKGDVLTCPLDAIRDTRCPGTYLDGRLIHEQKGEAP